MAQEKPSLIAQTKVNNEATRDVPVEVKRTVTYIMNFTSTKTLSLPYAVAINGVAQASFKTKPKRVNNGGKIVVSNVAPGACVTLYLNSDAHPSYRNHPVYAVVPIERDVLVKITEKSGKHDDSDTPTQIKDKDEKVENEKKSDTYIAALTGDIWMKVSHKYSESEVDSLVPTGTGSETIAAVKRIYAGLSEPLLSIEVPSVANEPAKKISIAFADSNNPKENIHSGYDLLNEGLKRVHPAGYVALFNAATEASVNKITMSSAWRPMLGSIAHRAGLGLDVNYVGTTRMNRQELTKKSAVNTTNVSDKEKELFADFEDKKKKQIEAKNALSFASQNAKKLRNDTARGPAAIEIEKQAKEISENADKARKDAEAAWNTERDVNEPEAVRAFRGSLMKCSCVSQLFDPWYMDTNNLDKISHEANMQKTENEKLHSHHLHITVYEPKIL